MVAYLAVLAVLKMVPWKVLTRAVYVAGWTAPTMVVYLAV